MGLKNINCSKATEDEQMRYPHLIIMTIIVAVFILRPSFLFGYDDEKTHRRINIEAVNQSTQLNFCLKDELGFSNGIDEEFKSKKVRLLIEEGGEREDDDFTADGRPFRSLRHFHDPLKSWDAAGLAGFDSCLVWAQEPNFFWNPYSWPEARFVYYEALTGGSEDDFAKLFRTLGQLVHLVSDAAVPAHVRSDIHPVSRPYENWAKDYDKEINYTGINVESSIFNRTVADPDYRVPISALRDQNTYTGENPLDNLLDGGWANSKKERSL